jgi:hypothetical protein
VQESGPTESGSIPPEDRDDVTHLQERIAALDEANTSDRVAGGQAVGLVSSLGFVVVSTLALGAYGGKWLAARYDMPSLQIGCLLLAVCFMFFSVYKLLRPFLSK